MKIQTSTVTSTISLASLVRASNGQSKVSFPVSSNDIAYANFKNIKIVPSGDRGSSYSVSRLRALDNLIEQLNRMKGENKIETPEKGSLNTKELSSLISKIAEEIHTKLDTSTSYKPSVKSTGLMVNILL